MQTAWCPPREHHKLDTRRPTSSLAGFDRGRALVDIAALAERLDVSVRFVRRLVHERRVPFLKIGKFIRFDPDEIDSWLDSHRVAER